MPEYITASISLTSVGKDVLASAWGFDSVSGRFVFRGITFKGGGASSSSITLSQENPNIDVSMMTDGTGRVTNISTVGNRIRIIVRYEPCPEPIRTFSLHCRHNGGDVVFAVCNTIDAINVKNYTTVCFAFEVDNSENGSLDFGHGAIYGVTAEDLSALATDLGQSISLVQNNVDNLASNMNHLKEEASLNNVTCTTLQANIGTFEEVSTSRIWTDCIEPKTHDVYTNIGSIDHPYGFIGSDVYLGRQANLKNFSRNPKVAVKYPMGDDGRWVDENKSPDAVFYKVSSAISSDVVERSEIKLEGSTNTQGTEAAKLTLSAHNAKNTMNVVITPDKVRLEGNTEVTNYFVTDTMKVTSSGVIGSVRISENTIGMASVTNLGGDSYSTDSSGEIYVIGRMLPKHSTSSLLGEDEHRWKSFLSVANVEGLQFKTPPAVTESVGRYIRYVAFPVGCPAFLYCNTDDVTVTNEVDGETLELIIWKDRGSSSNQTTGITYKTKNKFIVLSSAVAGRPFLAICVG